MAKLSMGNDVRFFINASNHLAAEVGSIGRQCESVYASTAILQALSEKFPEFRSQILVVADAAGSIGPTALTRQDAQPAPVTPPARAAKTKPGPRNAL